MLFHKKTFIFAPENEMWKDLSSLHIPMLGASSEKDVF